jgi:hypothetical protein
VTPQEIIDAARARYNASSDTFWSDAELLQHVWDACNELAHQAFAIEKYDDSETSVAGTPDYAFPTRCIALKRVEYDGKRLDPITFREDDQLTFFDSHTTQQGEPDFYTQWAERIYLRPTPDTSALVIGIYYFAEPDTVTAGSTLEVSTMWHHGIIDYVVALMALKEKNYTVSEKYDLKWAQTVARAKAWRRKRMRSDSFSVVQDESHFIEVAGVR